MLNALCAARRYLTLLAALVVAVSCSPAADPGGGSGGSGAAGSSGAEPVWDESSAPKSCPPSSGGPQLVPVRGGYCMDATEVTRSQYDAWANSNPTTSTQPDFCAWNTSFKPDEACMLGASGCNAKLHNGECGDYPRVCVDWCDAYAFCKAVGKRLCGKIGGGTAPAAEANDAKKNQWYNACSSGGINKYAYADKIQYDACNGMNQQAEVVPVGSMSDCASPVPGYAGIYDLTGNVWEWVDGCEKFSTDYTAAWDTCNAMGITALAGASGSGQCTGYANTTRGNTDDYLGFRCCSP